MNEIRLREVSDPLPIEVGPPDPESPCPAAPPLVRTEDRRVAQRYQARDGRCWIGWNDAVQFRQSAAWILNISVSGGLVALDAPPPIDRSIWLRLDNPSVPDWAEIKVVELKSSPSGIFGARIVFRGVCPYALFKAVAFGPANPKATRIEPPATWDLNSW